MMIQISSEEANVLAAYEPIESEFRTQTLKKCSGITSGIEMYCQILRNAGSEVGKLTNTITSYMRIEDNKIIFDYFPLD